MILFGQVIYNHDIDVAFLQIPKNVSSQFRALKDSHDKSWSLLYVGDLNASTRINVILRDPADRYMSAINMYLKSEGNLFRMPITFQNYLERDQHFALQKRFVDVVLDHSTLEFFYYNYNIVEEINEYYGLEIDTNRRLNNTPEKIVTDVNTDLIKKYYKEDYDLIQSTDFINT